MLEFIRKRREKVCELKIVELYKDYLVAPDGKELVYDFIRHKHVGGAGILMVDENEEVFLVRQYRNSIDALSVEIPAGGYSRIGESGEECARREAEEETGFFPQRIYHVANVVSSIGTFDEKTDIFIGTGLVQGVKKPDPDEYIEIIKVHVDKALDMIASGEIIDSKTLTALYAYKHMKAEGIIE